MVWNFQRFEGAPVLDDYINQKLKFQIFFPTDVPERCISEDPNYQKQISMPHLFRLQDDFYRMIDPVFNYPEKSIPHSEIYGLDLFEKGVIRKTMSRVQNPKHPNVHYVTPKKVGFGDFEDLKYIGEYSVQRLINIPKEIRLPAKSIENDLPSYVIDSRNWFLQETALTDWSDFVKVVAGRFNEWYLSYIMDRFEKAELSPDEVKILRDLVERLN
jgi:hypothetical protein